MSQHDPDRKQEMDLLVYAFKDFTQATETLRKSYRALQQKIAELTSELTETNETLSRKVSELNKVRTYLNNTLDSMMNGLIGLDSEGKITIFNKAAEQITGFNSQEVLGKSYENIFGEKNGNLVSIIKKAFRRGRSVVGERPFFSKKRKIFLEVIINPLVNPQTEKNRTEGFVVAFRDISMLKHLQEEIRHKERLALLGEMAASIAHEIRNPVSGIEGFALLLKKNLKEDDRRKQWINSIVKGARSLNNLVTNLLNFSRPLKVSFQPVALDELVEYSISFLQQKIREENLNLQLIKKFPSQSIRTLADPNLLRQVFLNLATNAVEAMPGGGRLIVRIRKKNYPGSEIHQFIREMEGDYTLNTSSGEVLIEFSDTGCGISPEEKEKILQPFYTTKSEGYGLGLAIVQQIIQKHRGKIEIVSKKGKGATFVVKLPLINDLKELKDEHREYSYSG